MKKIYFSTLLSALFCLQINAQAPKNYGRGEMELEFKKLANTVSVLYIAAHPDDENTRLISWLVNEKCVRTGYLSLTRGDGGQNLIGSEQGIALGVIRSQELLAARRVDGAEQFFTRAFDFGYSKTPEETFEKWNREDILADVVYVIRKFRPDIIITRFATDGSGGHGHHTASAMLAEEAFDVVVECSGSSGGAAVGLRAAKRGGKYVQVGIFGRDVVIPMDLVLYKELTVSSGFASTPNSWLHAMRLLKSRAVKLTPLITSQLPLDDFFLALAGAQKGEGLKTIILGR
jgi:hypothetical protein